MARIVSPLTRLDKIFTFRDYVVQAINEQLDEATSASDIMTILRQVHGNQLNEAASYKERIFKMLKEHEEDVLTRVGKERVEEFREYKEQQNTQNELKVTDEDLNTSLAKFEPLDMRDQSSQFASMGNEQFDAKEFDAKEDLYGGFGDDNGFGGISLDMLDEINKNEANESIGNQKEQFHTDGYIDKTDYYHGKSYSENNNERKQTWLTEQDNLFDPSQASAEQINEHPDYNPNKEPEVDENGSPLVKYKRKEKKTTATGQPVEDADTTGKGIAWLSYILFFLPLIFASKPSFVRHHANQGLIINILDVLCAVFIFAQKFITAEGMLLTVLQVVMFVGIFIEAMILPSRLALLISSMFGKRKRLPVLGKINIIK